MALDEDRFWSKVDMSGGPDACWMWTAYQNKDGYGQFGVGPRTHGAHRVSFLIAHGHWPKHLALHTCDNPSCVNPAHLYDGTDADNSRDMIARGRARHPGVPGELKSWSKLNVDAVRALRLRYASGESLRALAAEYGVSKQSAHKAIRGQTWRHV